MPRSSGPVPQASRKRFDARRAWVFGAVLIGIACLALLACGGGAAGSGKGTPSAVSGTIEIDGSSTVFPITQAVAEEFRKTNPGVQVPVGISGTGGGFKRFVVADIPIVDASRPIKDSEKSQASQHGVEFVELRVAFDGLSVVVNRSNDFVECLAVAELKKIWEPESTINRWKQVRASFPDQRLQLYGPGTDSGTFDYFTEAIVGKEDASRADYTASEDDNVLVQGVMGDRNALGYFGFAYYAENSKNLKLVAVDSGGGCVIPSIETIARGTYKPLSRPLFIYVNKKALERPAVREFVKFYMGHAAELVGEVGYVALPEADYKAATAQISD